MMDPKSPNPRDPDPAELAELYAAGALEPHEAAEFERRIAAGDGAYVAALGWVLGAMETLLRAGEVTPPARVRAVMAARVEAESAEAAAVWGGAAHGHDEEAAGVGGIVIARAATGRWRRTGLRGVRYQPLFADRRCNRRTLMLDMAPGTSLPDHGHAGDEEVIMISGDLSIAGTVLGPGDYIRIAAGAKHGVPRTVGGCVCVVVSGYVPFTLMSWPRMVWAAAKGAFKRHES
jgi:putative transcriptional regulator